MDLTALLGTLLSNESISGVSSSTGASQQQVQSVLGSALPALLNGANAQAQDEQSGFAGALQQHAANDTSNITSFLSGVDKIDGAKIIAHLLGVNTESQTQSLASQTGVSTAQTGSILATVAPLMMSLMGQQTAADQASDSSQSVGNLFGSLLGGQDVGSMALNLLGSSSQSSNSSSNKKKGGLLGLLLKLLK